MATSSLKHANAPAHPAAPQSAQERHVETPALRGTGLWWLWLVSDQAMIGTKQRSRTEPRSAAAPPDAAARSWAFADLALESK